MGENKVLIEVECDAARLTVKTDSVVIERTASSVNASGTTVIPHIEINFSKIDKVNVKRPEGAATGFIEFIPYAPIPEVTDSMLTLHFNPDKAQQFDSALARIAKQLNSLIPISEQSKTMRLKAKALPKLDLAYQWSSAFVVASFVGLVFAAHAQPNPFLSKVAVLAVVIGIPVWLIIVIIREILTRIK